MLSSIELWDLNVCNMWETLGQGWSKSGVKLSIIAHHAMSLKNLLLNLPSSNDVPVKWLQMGIMGMTNVLIVYAIDHKIQQSINS